MLQKRVVNVYRLITRGTLEEKIMGLQKFKMNIANTVISQENTSLQSMGTDQLLDLFTLDKVRFRFVGRLWALYNLCMKLGEDHPSRWAPISSIWKLYPDTHLGPRPAK